VTSVFFILSGEHPTLPKAEVEAILDVDAKPYTVLGEGTQLLRLDVDSAAAERVVGRSAYTHLCCREAFRCPAESLEEIFNSAEATSFNKFLSPGESFVVRVKRISGNSRHLNVATLERRLGAVIYRQVRGSKVNLERPDRVFLGFLVDGGLIFGLKLWEAEAKKFYYRTPRRKPFFHPSSLQPKLARCMVNLSRPREGDVIYDPFCGTGTVMIEAGLMGFETVGTDLVRRMIKGAKRNLNHFKVARYHLVAADALKPPIHRVDAVVTDPPYGRSATTKGLTTASIIEGFLSKVADLLSGGGAICIASPKTLDITGMAGRLGFRVKDIHQIHIHRSLTREIAVLVEM